LCTGIDGIKGFGQGEAKPFGDDCDTRPLFYIRAKIPGTETEIRVPADSRVYKSEEDVWKVGSTPDAFEDKLFQVFAEGPEPHQLNAGRGEFIGSRGTEYCNGLTTEPIVSEVDTNLPTSIAGVCGPMGPEHPGCGPIMNWIATLKNA
tara:strand:- start:6525 stop:6968 length:444 start_codon:yes stop_codon:yes gene_type:complete